MGRTGGHQRGDSVAAYGEFRVAAVTAAASGRPYIGTSSADMFWCTSAQDLCANRPFAHIGVGTPLTMVCWIDDRAPFPGSSPGCEPLPLSSFRMMSLFATRSTASFSYRAYD